MSLVEARNDYKTIVGAGEFSTSCTFTPVGVTPVSRVVSGLFFEHHNSVNTDGVPVNAKNSRLTICESDLTSQGYVTRSSNTGRITLYKHLVDIVDIAGATKHYIVKEILPDRSLGGITLILEDYGS
jgi:hypothetical protein